jgi:tRNA pseudouridine38-40 synthase
MKTWKLTIEYDGTKYSGWQEQRNARTVVGMLRKAAEDFLESGVELQGAGRTDAGVHAYEQVAHLRVERGGAPAKEILRAMNERLPADVSILSVEDAKNTFHARHDAIARTYAYHIATRRTAFFKKYVWWVRERLDVAAMARAARMLEGRHNFAAFRAQDAARPDESAIVAVESAEIDVEGELIVFRITASHFVWRMVRRIVGVLVKVGKGELGEDDVLRLLKGRAAPGMDIAAWTAPASGLFLEKVIYRGEERRKEHFRRFAL